ncbi:hypothetical protein Lepto7375DRAFT_3780 [Leptolyngbya sp. PCC 7375]|nr:hypothetical protein Lepto7375DRAFT_3780 [Leptolyngbya sp. PCC 7375]
MKASKICQQRRIFPIDVNTPILIPSFSSRGFPEVKSIYLQMRDFIVDVSLVSAYDLHYGFIDSDIYCSDLVFIDSGGYETQIITYTSALDDVYAVREGCSIQSWRIQDYEAILDGLEPNSQFVFISYDSHNLTSTLDQIKTSSNFFEKYPNIASEILLKPENKESNLINWEFIVNNVNYFSNFSIIGVTEKELGKSILERCQNLLRLRSALYENGCNIPIHVLGCLDPALIITYFLCGADIFDGLAWLRYSFFEGLALYNSTSIILQEHWEISEIDLPKLYGVRNLQVLNNLSNAMQKFYRTQNLNEFDEWKLVMPNILNLVQQVGLDFEE